MRLMIGLALLLMGCGTSDGGAAGTGGGGAGGAGAVGGRGGSPIIMPVVIETVPQGMATDVATDTVVQASFNTPLDVATVTMASFLVRGGDGISLAGTVDVDPTGLIATFTPDAPLDLSSPYRATVTTRVQSVSGGALEAQFEWAFATRDGAWTEAAPIDLGDTEARLPDVSMDAGGNAIAVWSQIEESDFQVWTNRFVPSVGWGEAVVIGDSEVAGTARVASDPEGNAIAVWDGSSEMTENIWANRYSPIDDWGGGEPIEDEPGDAEAPRVVADAFGNAIALWRQEEGARFDIWASRLDPNTGWSGAERIEANNAGDANFPQLAMSPQGNAMAVWGQSDGTRVNVWANRFTAGVGWENAVIIERRDGGASLPDVGVSSEGSAVAVWTQGTTVTNVWSNRFAAENRWGDAELIETGDAGDASDV
ncbi:MAG: Ig-like domain-containing protein, partial [Polyangiales bacterium]